jgi:hypothetical protein
MFVHVPARGGFDLKRWLLHTADISYARQTYLSAYISNITVIVVVDVDPMHSDKLSEGLDICISDNCTHGGVVDPGV